MKNYDGPSFYKKDHPKLKSIKKQKNRFEQAHKRSMPNQVRTREDLKNEAFDYMETPSIKPKPEKYSFRSKEIPKSLQYLEGWQKTKKNHQLIEAIEARLEKEKSSYLLFDGYLEEEESAENIAEEAEKPAESEKKEFAKEERPAKEDQKAAAKQKIRSKETKQTATPAQKKAEQVKEKLTSTAAKPTSGLHRSLSKIIAEDQEAMQNGKNNLNSLFSEDR